MTGFQRTIATLGGLSGALALVLAVADVGEAGVVMIVGSILLAAAGLRHYLGLMPEALSLIHI